MKFFYFVRAPLGGGGRHLANLMSLDNSVSPSLPQIKSKQEWFEFLIAQYNNTIEIGAHFSHSIIISDARWKADLASLDNSMSSVHHGHASSFDWAKDTLDQLPNKRYVLLTFNTPASRNIVMKREKQFFGTETLKNAFYVEEICHFYNIQFKDDTVCNDDLNFAIEIENIFVEDITSVISKLNEHFCMNIPMSDAQYLHKIWWSHEKLKI
jgi:hypothetical protein